jgi:hypothetical protein
VNPQDPKPNTAGPIALDLSILRQPDNSTCGPTSLHAVYKYYGDDIELKQVIAQTHKLVGGGTLAVMLGCHALERGYHAKLFTFNLNMFDPTWFTPEPVPSSASPPRPTCASWNSAGRYASRICPPACCPRSSVETARSSSG